MPGPTRSPRLHPGLGAERRASGQSAGRAVCQRPPRALVVPRVACVSTPSVYRKLRELRREGVAACVFEYDRRFAVYGEDFVFYDYNSPLDFPGSIAAHSFQVVVADPPYLSKECLRKTAETIKYLTRGKIVLCTGEVRPPSRGSGTWMFGLQGTLERRSRSEQLV